MSNDKKNNNSSVVNNSQSQKINNTPNPKGNIDVLNSKTPPKTTIKLSETPHKKPLFSSTMDSSAPVDNKPKPNK